MTSVIVLSWLLVAQTGCPQAVVAPDAAELCAAEQQVRQAESQPVSNRRRPYEEAAEHARRAASAATTTESKASAVDLLARIYDERHLNEPNREQTALLDLVALRPHELGPVDRLSRLLERLDLPDAAEETLLAAHRQQPGEEEAYRLLAQFYARRVTALHRASATPKPEPQVAAPQPDENGVYKVGGPIPPPKRADVAVYPQEARDAGIQGVVILEVVIDEAGNVGDAKVLRSIPLLDEPAVNAARAWHFTPTMVNGQPVKVKMAVTQNFTLK